MYSSTSHELIRLTPRDIVTNYSLNPPPRPVTPPLDPSLSLVSPRHITQLRGALYSTLYTLLLGPTAGVFITVTRRILVLDFFVSSFEDWCPDIFEFILKRTKWHIRYTVVDLQNIRNDVEKWRDMLMEGGRGRGGRGKMEMEAVVRRVEGCSMNVRVCIDEFRDEVCRMNRGPRWNRESMTEPPCLTHQNFRKLIDYLVTMSPVLPEDSDHHIQAIAWLFNTTPGEFEPFWGFVYDFSRGIDCFNKRVRSEVQRWRLSRNSRLGYPQPEETKDLYCDGPCCNNNNNINNTAPPTHRTPSPLPPPPQKRSQSIPPLDRGGNPIPSALKGAQPKTPVQTLRRRVSFHLPSEDDPGNGKDDKDKELKPEPEPEFSDDNDDGRYHSRKRSRSQSRSRVDNNPRYRSRRDHEEYRGERGRERGRERERERERERVYMYGAPSGERQVQYPPPPPPQQYHHQSQFYHGGDKYVVAPMSMWDRGAPPQYGGWRRR
ncbi:hypothetical protein EX30DRAFT_395028 [Ascodesmis nigricans]|uniref:Uncharacterized protein n=1 Tax=Ascodesmis nigricans TaxID=341454 RepID=A0A4V3SJ16_9PEZI|nr:hypothetical protein EX30DRAFT_395028 [Ascodesmis nigricans]